MTRIFEVTSKVTFLDTATLLRAYAMGIFPMAESAENTEIHWIKPRERGVVPLDARFHIPRSLKKTLRRGDHQVRFDQDFDAVLSACAGGSDLTCPRPDTWINSTIHHLYQALHHEGHAHSVEVYDSKGTLIGGLYGLALGGAFFGESMFSKRSNASKIALVSLMAHLSARGFLLLDCQFLTEHLAQFGSYTVPAEQYDHMLRHALQQHCLF
ncbi:MAG: leucyl/phenylalanyl-tRNA--protein transferase [Alphaproteobacteria bacterium]|nr:leucyl/phenylalanyl-tRNA--protein transferase [Alphaproteobacteria bacterium]